MMIKLKNKPAIAVPVTIGPFTSGGSWTRWMPYGSTMSCSRAVQHRLGAHYDFSNDAKLQ